MYQCNIIHKTPTVVANILHLKISHFNQGLKQCPKKVFVVRHVCFKIKSISELWELPLTKWAHAVENWTESHMDFACFCPLLCRFYTFGAKTWKSKSGILFLKRFLNEIVMNESWKHIGDLTEKKFNGNPMYCYPFWKSFKSATHKNPNLSSLINSSIWSHLSLELRKVGLLA